MVPFVFPVEVQPPQRRQLAAVLLRGRLDRYDAVPALAQTVDNLVDVLVADLSVTWPAGLPYNYEQFLDRFAYRLAGGTADKTDTLAEHALVVGG